MADNKYEQYVSRITLPNDDKIYGLKDEDARQQISNLENKVTAAVYYRGVVDSEETVITDNLEWEEATEITFSDGTKSFPKNGDVVAYTPEGSNTQLEFIFKQTGEPGVGVWNEFGSTSSLKGLAFKDSVTVSYKPTGNIVPTISTIQITPTGTYTPTGSITAPKFTGKEGNVTVTGTLPDKISLNFSKNETNGSVGYTPTGAVTGTFEGNDALLTLHAENPSSTDTAVYVPEGNIGTPTITISPTIATINTVKTNMELPTFFGENEGEELKISFNSGTKLTTTAQEVMIGATASSTAPSFTGKRVVLRTSYKPTGRLKDLNFSGATTYLSGELEGNAEKSFNGTYTPEGTVNAPDFIGNETTISTTCELTTMTGAKFDGQEATLTIS